MRKVLAEHLVLAGETALLTTVPNCVIGTQTYTDRLRQDIIFPNSTR